MILENAEYQVKLKKLTVASKLALTKSRKEKIIDSAGELDSQIEQRIKSIALNRFALQKKKRLQKLGKTKEEINELISNISASSPALIDRSLKFLSGLGIDKKFVGLNVDEILSKFSIDTSNIPDKMPQDLDLSPFEEESNDGENGKNYDKIDNKNNNNDFYNNGSQNIFDVPRESIPEKIVEHRETIRELEQRLSEKTTEPEASQEIINLINQNKTIINKFEEIVFGGASNSVNNISEINQVNQSSVNNISEINQVSTYEQPVNKDIDRPLKLPTVITEQPEIIQNNNEKVYDYLVKTGEFDAAEHVLELMTRPDNSGVANVSDIQRNTKEVKHLSTVNEEIKVKLEEIHEDMVDEQDTSIDMPTKSENNNSMLQNFGNETNKTETPNSSLIDDIVSMVGTLASAAGGAALKKVKDAISNKVRGKNGKPPKGTKIPGADNSKPKTKPDNYKRPKPQVDNSKKPKLSASKIGGKPTGILKKLAKFTKVIPVLGTAIAAGTAIYAAQDGYRNADEILEKDPDNITETDKLASAVGSVVNDFTFGMVPTKGTAEKIISFVNPNDPSVEKTVEKLDSQGIIDWDSVGNSEIINKEALLTLSSKEIKQLIDFDDWSSEDMGVLKETLVKVKEIEKATNINQTIQNKVTTNTTNTTDSTNTNTRVFTSDIQNEMVFNKNEQDLLLNGMSEKEFLETAEYEERAEYLSLVRRQEILEKTKEKMQALMQGENVSIPEKVSAASNEITVIDEKITQFEAENKEHEVDFGFGKQYPSEIGEKYNELLVQREVAENVYMTLEKYTHDNNMTELTVEDSSQVIQNASKVEREVQFNSNQTSPTQPVYSEKDSLKETVKEMEIQKQKMKISGKNTESVERWISKTTARIETLEKTVYNEGPSKLDVSKEKQMMNVENNYNAGVSMTKQYDVSRVQAPQNSNINSTNIISNKEPKALPKVSQMFSN
jgi:hypothetical protein